MPRVVDHVKQRDELLLGCFDLFAEKGFTGVSMRQVALRLGISTGALYHYFSSKMEMLREMLGRAARFEIRLASSLVSGNSDIGAKLGMLSDYFLQRENFLRSFFLLTVDFHRHCRDRESVEFMKDFLNSVSDAIAVNIGISRTAAGQLFVYYSGLFYNRLVFGKPEDYRSASEQFNRIFLAGLERED